jgi:hypothetical protein
MMYSAKARLAFYKEYAAVTRSNNAVWGRPDDDTSWRSVRTYLFSPYSNRDTYPVSRGERGELYLQDDDWPWRHVEKDDEVDLKRILERHGADVDGDATVEAAVVKVSGFFVPVARHSECSGVVAYFRDRTDDLREAAYAANHNAQSWAEDAYADSIKDKAQQEIESLRDEIYDIRVEECRPIVEEYKRYRQLNGIPFRVVMHEEVKQKLLDYANRIRRRCVRIRALKANPYECV